MRIVLVWQPDDSPGPQTVYVEDATDRDVQVVAAAVAARESDPNSLITLSNVALSDGDPQRGEFLFRVGRLLSYEVQA